jgi:hypothetical protein
MHISRASTKQPQAAGHVPDMSELPFTVFHCVTLITQSKINRKQSRIFVDINMAKYLDWVHYTHNYKTFHTL